jgi:hypothetical protein
MSFSLKGVDIADAGIRKAVRKSQTTELMTGLQGWKRQHPQPIRQQHDGI